MKQDVELEDTDHGALGGGLQANKAFNVPWGSSGHKTLPGQGASLPLPAGGHEPHA